ncbi:MAG: phosphatidate cytidylyltransferase [Lachnospiraceae bacterium]|nr:phosphatidate cytidylyltransferase [Lachnospiraceae bacterium]
MVDDNNKTKKLSKFFTRLISGILLLLALFVILFIGGDILILACTVLSIIGLIELFQVFKLAKSMFAYISYVLTVFYYLMLRIYSSSGILLFLISLLLFLLIFYVFSYPKYDIHEVSLIFFGIIYVAVTFSFIYLIREKNEFGKYIVWLIFISSWGSDTFAYCVGMLIGKHKFLPLLSPNKTIEGVVGGIIGAAILGVIYNIIFLNKFYLDPAYSSLQIGLACAGGAIISMLGDLTASAIKRDNNVKDYGNIIPGHGGILDRFDSVIFTAPALFFILSI